jgi:hypothetical protein
LYCSHCASGGQFAKTWRPDEGGKTFSWWHREFDVHDPFDHEVIGLRGPTWLRLPVSVRVGHFSRALFRCIFTWYYVSIVHVFFALELGRCFRRPTLIGHLLVARKPCRWNSSSSRFWNTGSLRKFKIDTRSSARELLVPGFTIKRLKNRSRFHFVRVG